MKKVDKYKLYPVREVSDELKALGVDIGYTGIMYYRNLGLIPPPERVEGSKEKLYNVIELSHLIQSIKLTSAIFNINYQKLSKLLKGVSFELIEALPFYFMRLMTGNKFFLEANSLSDSFWSTFIASSGAFLIGVSRATSAQKKLSPKKFYGGVVYPALIKSLEKICKAMDEMVNN